MTRLFRSLFIDEPDHELLELWSGITRNSDNNLAHLKIVQLVPCRLNRFDFFRNIASFNTATTPNGRM